MEFFKSLTLFWKRVIAASLGLIAGYAYYYYIGCASGTCPITGNPYISSLYGGLMGLLLVPSKKSAAKDEPAKQDPV
ncbi:MAG TPA: DUF6132 family protein [Bacteroidota bacterium]|nr:DUF6132 family protein [Bacteroidota bacterium]